MKNALTNLHNNKQSLGKAKNLINNIREKIGHIGDQLSAHFPDAITNANAVGQNFQIKKLKSKLMQKLDTKRKKFKLALESLGWGTLADLLDSAFCGEKLNLWV